MLKSGSGFGRILLGLSNRYSHRCLCFLGSSRQLLFSTSDRCSHICCLVVKGSGCCFVCLVLGLRQRGGVLVKSSRHSVGSTALQPKRSAYHIANPNPNPNHLPLYCSLCGNICSSPLRNLARRHSTNISGHHFLGMLGTSRALDCLGWAAFHAVDYGRH